MDRQANGGAATAALTQYTWERQPEAERLVRELTEEFLRKCPEAARLAERMKDETGTRFGDWVDYIEVWDRLLGRTPSAKIPQQRLGADNTAEVRK